jgi:hypothetical protein
MNPLESRVIKAMHKDQEIQKKFQSEMGISPEFLSELVQRVLYLIAQRINEQNPDKEYVMVVFTGATAGFVHAFTAVEELMLSGLEVRIVLSDSAERIYGDIIKKRLLSWPTASLSSGERWFCELKGAKGVIVPMLSVSALSKVSRLMADSLTTNLILQALFMGKPVVAAIDGCEPGNSDRQKLGLDSGTPALQQALGQLLIRLNDFGCSLVRCHDLGWMSKRLLTGMEDRSEGKKKPENVLPVRQDSQEIAVSSPLSAKMVDSALVRQALRENRIVKIDQGGVITPLALELAQKYGLQIIK